MMDKMKPTAWFTRDFAMRPLKKAEVRLLNTLSDMLNEERPQQVDPNLTLFTAEGSDVLIPIIPHKSLDGLSIFIWFWQSSAQVCWGQIGDLTWHDDLDAGKAVAVFKDLPEEKLIESVVRATREELHRAIEIVEATSQKGPSTKAEFRLADDQKSIRWGDSWLSFFQRKANKKVMQVITFCDLAPPVIGAPPNIEGWFLNK